MLDEGELAWLDERMRGDVDHLLVRTSLPFLLGPGLHRVEAFGEALAQGAWGRLASKVGEVFRQTADLEHWAAFQGGFVQVARMVVDVASGRRGATPRSVTFLSGDVHHSYVALASADPEQEVGLRSVVVQAVCSPIRNPLPGVMKAMINLAAKGRARQTGRLLGGKVPRSPLRWRLARGPWYDNNLAVLELQDDRLHFWWSRGEVDGDVDRPRTERVATVDVPLADAGSPADRRGLPRSEPQTTR